VGDNLTSRAMRGLSWSYGGVLLNVVLQLGLGAVMARLVAPSAFGVLAMSTLAMRFAQYFAQMGVGSAVVQRKGLTDDHIRAAFWLSTGLGLVVWATLSAIGPVLARFFREPSLVQIVPVIALTFIFGGISTTALATLRRAMHFRDVAMIDVASFLASYGLVGLTLAYRGYGVWSLVAATVTQSFLAGAGYLVRGRHPILPFPARESFDPILHFGSRVSLASLLEYLNANLDTIGVGRLLGPGPLGYYSRALSLSNLPTYNLQVSLSRVLLPAFAQQQESKPKLKEAYLAGFMMLGMLVIPVGWGVGAASIEVTSILLGPAWLPVIPLLAITSLAAPLTALTNISEVMCEATGALGFKLRVRSIQLPVLAAALYLASRWGTVGFAVVFVVSETCIHVAYSVIAGRTLSIRASEFWATYRPVLLGGALVASSVLAVGSGLRAAGAPLVLTAVLEVSIAAIVWLVGLLRLDKGRVWRIAVAWIERAGVRNTRVLALVDRLSRYAACAGSPKVEGDAQ
jgi:lipopolysaccharide exporter